MYVDCVLGVDVRQRSRVHPGSAGPGGPRAVAHSDPVAPSLLNFTVVSRMFVLSFGLRELIVSRTKLILHIKTSIMDHYHCLHFQT